jgi:hypothetical protein
MLCLIIGKTHETQSALRLVLVLEDSCDFGHHVPAVFHPRIYEYVFQVIHDGSVYLC